MLTQDYLARGVYVLLGRMPSTHTLLLAGGCPDLRYGVVALSFSWFFHPYIYSAFFSLYIIICIMLSDYLTSQSGVWTDVRCGVGGVILITNHISFCSQSSLMIYSAVLLLNNERRIKRSAVLQTEDGGKLGRILIQ